MNWQNDGEDEGKDAGADEGKIVGNEMKDLEDMIGKQGQGLFCQGVSGLKLLPLQEVYVNGTQNCQNFELWCVEAHITGLLLGKGSLSVSIMRTTVAKHHSGVLMLHMASSTNADTVSLAL